jgi:hypothetical protein
VFYREIWYKYGINGGTNFYKKLPKNFFTQLFHLRDYPPFFNII